MRVMVIMYWILLVFDSIGSDLTINIENEIPNCKPRSLLPYLCPRQGREIIS